MNLNRFLTFLAVGLTPAVCSQAGTNGFSVPFFRGAPNSEAGYWENLSVAAGPPGNLADRPGSTTGALLTQHQTNAILTSTFNLYNPSDVSDFTLDDSTPFVLGTVVLQARTLGSELDYGSVHLNYSDAAGLHALSPLFRLERDRSAGFGATVSSLWQWDLAGLGITNYSISFKAADSSLSFDSMTLDTWNEFAKAVPEIFFNSREPALERWMYPFNADPCGRPAGSVFGTLGDSSGVDSRHAQHLLGWDTANVIPPGRGPSRYLVRSCRVTLTINRGGLFVYDPTHDDFRSYFETNHAAYLPDPDAGRPVEMFGVDFRNGFNAASFEQCSPFGNSAVGQRNAFTASWSTNGTLVDVGNNVGKTNESHPSFEAWPFAVGRTENAAPAEPVPAGAKLTFDLNLEDPFVLAYLQRGLNEGRLRLGISSLHESSMGQPAFPDFVTHFSEIAIEPTRIELAGVATRDTDSDGDGLPDDWEEFYLGHLAAAGSDDSDADGRSNAEELIAGTNPRIASSAFRVASIKQADETNVTLRWPHAASRKYSLEFTEDFGGWTSAPAFAPGFFEPGIAEWRDTSAAATKRFYRLRVE
jgi:hypothetical protein